MIGPSWHQVRRHVRALPGGALRLLRHLLTRRGLLILAGALVCGYAITILIYVQTVPDLGIRAAFTPEIKHVHPGYQFPDDERSRAQTGDRVVGLGNQPVETWLDMLRSVGRLHEKLSHAHPDAAELARLGVRERDGVRQVRVAFDRDGARFTSWFAMGHLPVKEVVPSILWFCLKLGLFLVGALVFWKRPTDQSATVFFLLCIVTLGAYMGGYLWSHILTQTFLIVPFMICGNLLPAVSLHFFLVFPRPRQFLRRHPRWTLLAVYGLAAGFLVCEVAQYLCIRLGLGDEPTLLSIMLETILVYFGIAGLYYLASIVCLVHSLLTVTDPTERNQVKWILGGALTALVPISYSFYLAYFEPADFGAGKATWPMFFASVFFTVAFAVSITRYRLMQLDQLVSSGVIYFSISFLAGLVYYAIVFLGSLVFTQVMVGPSLTHALMVSTTALVLMLVLDLARSRLKKALDRRFSRQKSQLDRTLQRMGQAIEQLVDPPTLAQRLLQASAELLGVSRGAVYLREGRPPLYRLAGSLGAPPPLTELSPGCPLVEALQARGALVARAPAAAGDPGQRQLRFLGGEAAHALAHEGQLLALLVLGPKDRDVYRPEDLDLLGAFAQITVLALGSAEGHRTIEALNRDLQAKVEKISEQQRRILALQSQLRKQALVPGPAAPAGAPEAANGDGAPASPIIGSSLPVRHLLELIRKVSDSEAVVLIRGESGTGKELLAKAIHDHSPRAARPFVKVHCAALSQGLLESELFGHVKGAFTGAHRDKVGRFELANGGTLFLDEIGDITLEVQTKLLRVLQEKAFERVGSSEPVQVDVRIIAATHQDLELLIQQGRFRLDLYYRLNVISVPVPSLRDRVEDVPELALHFLRLFGQRCGKPVMQIDDEALVVLKGCPWPGNVRQLENVIEQAVVMAEDDVVTVAELPPDLVAAAGKVNGRPAPPGGMSVLVPGPVGREAERDLYDRAERERLVRALAAAEGNKARAARALGLARSTLLSRLKKHGLS